MITQNGMVRLIVPPELHVYLTAPENLHKFRNPVQELSIIIEDITYNALSFFLNF